MVEQRERLVRLAAAKTNYHIHECFLSYLTDIMLWRGCDCDRIGPGDDVWAHSNGTVHVCTNVSSPMLNVNRTKLCRRAERSFGCWVVDLDDITSVAFTYVTYDLRVQTMVQWRPAGPCISKIAAFKTKTKKKTRSIQPVRSKDLRTYVLSGIQITSKLSTKRERTWVRVLV